MSLKKIVLYILLSTLVLSGVVFLFRERNIKTTNFLNDISSSYKESSGKVLRTITSLISFKTYSAPFFKSSPSKTTNLSAGKIVSLTNAERVKLPGLLALTQNNLLDHVAEARAQDMFAKQYFSHISPTASGATSTAEIFGYKYITIGENIALGDFSNEEALVAAWMASPGHRENILSSHYEEIGVAVLRGNYQGDKVLIAVQIFGRPLSSCALPPVKLKSSIESNTEVLSTLEKQATDLLVKLNTDRPKTQESVALYNQNVEVYNSIIQNMKSLQKSLQDMVSEYNGAVRVYNNCLEN